MALTLNIFVDRLDDVLTTFNQIKVFRSTSATGIFIEVTTPTTRIALESGKNVYEFIDATGDETFFYQITYFNSTTLAESSKSDVQSGATDPALCVISVEELKNIYLFGIDLTDDDGNPIPDNAFEFYIKSAVQWFEDKVDIAVTPKSLEEQYDFVREDYYRHIFLKVDTVPVMEVSRVELILPTNQSVINFDLSWLQLQKEAGQINIIPGNTQTSTIVLGGGGNWLPFIYNTAKFIPNAFHVDYTAGFPKGQVPADIRHAIGMIASYGPLNIAGDLLGGAGIASQSISLDGLSQSFNTTSSATNAGYGARILQYTKELKDMLPQLRRKYHPVALEVV